MQDMYQTVVLTMADGRKVSYVGRPQMEVDNQLIVIGITVSSPKSLPNGLCWEMIGLTWANVPSPLEGGQ